MIAPVTSRPGSEASHNNSEPKERGSTHLWASASPYHERTCSVSMVVGSSALTVTPLSRSSAAEVCTSVQSPVTEGLGEYSERSEESLSPDRLPRAPSCAATGRGWLLKGPLRLPAFGDFNERPASDPTLRAPSVSRPRVPGCD